MTINDLLNNPIFLICAPVSVILILVIIVLCGGGDWFI